MIPAWYELADAWTSAIVRLLAGGYCHCDCLGSPAMVDVALAARRVLGLPRRVLEAAGDAGLEPTACRWALLPASMRKAPLPVPRFEPMETFDSARIADVQEVERPPTPPAPRPWPITAAMLLLPLWSIGVGYCSRSWLAAMGRVARITCECHTA